MAGKYFFLAVRRVKSQAGRKFNQIYITTTLELLLLRQNHGDAVVSSNGSKCC